MTEQPSSSSSKRKLLVGGGIAVVAAAAIAVVFVLPAEYGIDPTGAGKALGLTRIAAPPNKYLEKGLKRKGVFTRSDSAPTPEPGATDHWQFELGPFEAIEFKYVVEQGKPFTFFWRASGPLDFDMHAHPFEGGTALTESYAIEQADHLGGRYVAPFTGIHGWYWQNRTLNRVQLTLDASGAMTGSKIFDMFGEHDRALEPSGSAAIGPDQ
jgi:hypothetical protein